MRGTVMRWISADTIWRLLSWAGTGAVLGGALALIGAAVLSPAERWDGGAPLLHWGLYGALVLLAVLWVFAGGEQRPGTGFDPRPGEGSGPIRAAAVLTGCLALAVAWRERPSARDPLVRELGEGDPLPAVLVDFGAYAHLGYLAALTLLVGALMLAAAGRPEPLRPAAGRPRRQALLSGLAPVVVIALLAVLTALERDGLVHTLAKPLTVAAATTHGDEVTWVWEHPEEGSAGELSVVAAASGVLAHGPGGVWALDGRDGAERWRFQPAGAVLWAEVTPDGERAAVLYQEGDPGKDRDRGSLAVLDADTGQLIGDHPVNRETEEVLLTNRTFLQVEEDGDFTLRTQTPGEAEVRYEAAEGCVRTGAPVVAAPRILVPEKCREEEDDAEAAEDWSHRLRVLTDAGEGYGNREVPGPVTAVEAAPDGWAVVVHYGGDEPGALAVRGRAEGVIAEDLPTEPGRVVPVDGDLLMYTETDGDSDQVEYRRESPVVGEPGDEVPDTETVDSLVFATPAPASESVAVNAELFAAVRAQGTDGNGPAALLVGTWGAEGVEVPLDSAAEGLAPDGSSFGVALAPHAIVVSGFSVGDRAQVIGVSSGAVS